MSGHRLRYLSRADIAALALPPAAVADAIAAMFAEKAAGRTSMVPKSHFKAAGGTSFFSMPAALGDPPIAAVKWIGLAHDNATRGLPHISGVIVLSDTVTGLPVAIMDGEWVTAARTAGMSAVAARHLARPDSRTIGFIACGTQARSHLAALAAMLPLRRVIAYGHRHATAEAFAAEARGQGFEAVVAAAPNEAVAHADIVVTSVPEQPGLDPFLDPAWLKPGAFVAAVDLGRCWHKAGLRDLDRLVTDDHGQSRAMAPSGRLAWPGDYDADLTELVGGAKPGRGNGAERAMFIFSGLALADAAVAARLYTEATHLDKGTLLPL
ncbi:MAG: ornithine cyclodeaminase family protein [Alphaproteobacteria bacterium]|nr:ornithine cyclodeaminase family protein [Alphaproteobacteria bacterium]